MSKLSFRARALDASKPLPVFRCEDLPDLHEYASINRAVPQMPTGMEKEEESVCFCIADRLFRALFIRVFTPRELLMLPAQAGAKWPPCLLFRAHDGSRRIPNLAHKLHFVRVCKIATVRYWVCKPGCVHLFCFKPPLKAQRSHVTPVCASILLTFWSVKTSGNRPRTARAPSSIWLQGETASTRSRLGLTARLLRVDSSWSAMCAVRTLEARAENKPNSLLWSLIITCSCRIAQDGLRCSDLHAVAYSRF